MKVFHVANAERVEPPGHFGHLEVATITDLDEVAFRAQVSFCPPGGGGELHHHDDDDQLFVVVSGELTFRIGSGEEFTLGEHDAVLFKAGEAHYTENRSADPSVSIVVTARR